MASTDARFSTEIFRKDHPIILAARRDLASLKPVRLSSKAADYLAGQTLARNDVSGFYTDYDSGASSGLDVAVGFLFENVTDEEIVAGNTIARLIAGGEVFKSKLIDLDAGGETDLNARTIIDATGVEILKF